jgi:hypothetical protein
MATACALSGGVWPITPRLTSCGLTVPVLLGGVDGFTVPAGCELVEVVGMHRSAPGLRGGAAIGYGDRKDRLAVSPYTARGILQGETCKFRLEVCVVRAVVMTDEE